MADHTTNKRLISNVDISTPEKSPLIGDNKKPRIEKKVESETDDIDTETDDFQPEMDGEVFSQESTPDYIYTEYKDKIEKYGLKNVLIQHVRNDNSLLSCVDRGRSLYENSSEQDDSDNESSNAF